MIIKDSPRFRIADTFRPAGSQPEAIKKLVKGLDTNLKAQTLLGVTGSGKTFTMANVIEASQKPTLVIVHNKTLAAQLYSEFKEFFPGNRVEFFVSYYDYYQPESYIPQKDMYIEKDSSINPKIEQMRLSATASLLSRRDTIVIASVSCIYGLGKPDNFQKLGFDLEVHQNITRTDILKRLIASQYERNDLELLPGRFRVKGDTIDFIPGYFNNIVRIELLGDKIERIRELDKVTGNLVEDMKYAFVFPAKHFVVPEDEVKAAIQAIRTELDQTLPGLEMLESHRLKQRTLYDVEMLEETGFCKGIENYSRHFDGRKPGEKPYTLMDYMPEDFLLIIDESHQTIPQLHAMYNGDKSRKKNLVEYGFRLPCAYDNRPLRFEEFKDYMKSVIFVSATPGEYELKESSQVVEQIIRPTGLVDPEVEIRPIKGQVDDLIKEVEQTIKKGNRALVTTLTKKLAEELSEFLASRKIKTRYLHSEIDTLERSEIIRELRLGKFDVLVGINLLREGLDIPEVAFIGILDADKEGFLRNDKSLIQIIGRAARNSESKVILYADNMTDSIKRAICETERRRSIQLEYNKEHGITPKTIIKPVKAKEVEIKDIKHIPKKDIPNVIIELEEDMKKAADDLDFEKAIALRDRLKKLKERIR
ncbi:excinuclease ABC subunit UvrB [Candidatus Woesearchaeota archaeon]|nr:excinuclease ABC subunit UvrB [Candidatus Woesearchaeota archaeon]